MRERRSTYHNRFRRRFSVSDRLASYGRAASPLAAGGGAYTHNAAGCVTRIERDGRPTLDLTWDSQYQLVSVSTNGVFAEGKGVPQDRAEASRLYSKAAAMGLKESLFNVGTCYDMGWGVEKNREEALKWYRKAAAQGCKLADDMIALLTRKQ